MSGICTARSPPCDAGSFSCALVLVVRSVVLGSGPLRKNGLDDILAHNKEEHLQPSPHGAILKHSLLPSEFMQPHVKAPPSE